MQTQVDFSRLEANAAEVHSRQTNLLSHDLAPYDGDDVFLMGRIVGPNRLLRRAPELKPQIQAALLGNDDESLIGLADDLESARQLYSPRHEKPINTILSLMNLLENINDIRMDMDADKHIAPRLNTLFELMYRNSAYSFPEAMLDDAQLTADYLTYRMQKLYEQAYERSHVQDEKAAGLSGLNNLRIRLGGTHEAIKSCNESHKYIDGLAGDTAPETLSQPEVEEDSRYVAELFGAIRAGQQYGVKMGYKSDDYLGGALLFSPPLSSKDFTDPEVLQAAYHPLLDKTDAVALIIHSQRKHHDRLKVTLDTPDDRGYSMAGINDLGPASTFALGPDGELYTWRDCKLKLRDIAIQKGKYKAYRALQATVLAHYYDLTHPLDEVARINKALREQPPQIDPRTRAALESIERLVVPRIKWYVQEHSSGIADADAEPDTRDTPTRTLRLHGVTWHRRQLPEGWHASPAALQLAEKMGVTLGENETIVKEHKRGTISLGEIAAHRFVTPPQVE